MSRPTDIFFEAGAGGRATRDRLFDELKSDLEAYETLVRALYCETAPKKAKARTRSKRAHVVTDHHPPTAPVSIVIVNYNSGERLKRCLDALAAQTLAPLETIVVDNASTDGSVAQALGSAHAMTLIEAGSNLGFAAANNRAAKSARGEWLVLLNPDAYPLPNWLQELMAAAARYPFADAFGSAQIDAKDESRLDGAGDAYHVFGIAYRGHFGWPAAKLPPDGECFAPCAAAAMYRRDVFLDLGGFDERFFCYGEDVDLGFRLRLSGRRSVQVNAARVLHEGSGVTGRYSDFTVYHGNRNRIFAHFKNMPGLLYWPLAPAHLAVNFYLIARAFTIGAGPACARAVRDGYLGLPAYGPSRREIQRARKIPLRELVRMLCWSPLAVVRRRSVLRAIEPASGREVAAS